ncbi:hypothetical protein Cri9333_4399 [Crinalium epipsammum PCC 9333]|uniref:Uncharacterized protein n=1 Tax=Crinalium epipsammum PCC 9333 TaxID=1173022 RepID=K9W607_9CYAN|nr:hypothetical protein [Crinalium epipsammum]AFZ15182.1 hypothetical protein Cri9333_4399 [Crinalium epipsammum PCC 9333]
MLITQPKQCLAQITVWCTDNSLPENEENLAAIRKWWALLDGKTIVWEVFGANIGSTIPIIRESLVVKNPLIEDNLLCWRKQGLQNWNSIPVQHLVLDSSLQRLEIISSLQSGFVSKYRIKVLG